MKKRRKGITRSKEKREIKGKGGELGIIEHVFRIVEVRYCIGNHINLPPKNVLAPLWPPHSKKLAPPLPLT